MATKTFKLRLEGDSLRQHRRRKLHLLRYVRTFCGPQLWLISTPAIHSQELTPGQKQALQQIVNLQVNLDAGKVNSPATKLEAKQIGTRKSDSTLFVGYHLYASGFTGEAFQLMTIPVGPKADPVSMGSGLSLASDGEVMDGPDDPRTIWFPNFLPGEPARMGLASADGKQRAFVTVVPNPIQGTDGACRVDVIRLLPKFEIAYVRGTGFPPNSEIAFEGNSLGEIHTGKLKMGADGRGGTAILPAVKDKPEGDIEVTFSAPQCKPTVKFHWGSKSH